MYKAIFFVGNISLDLYMAGRLQNKESFKPGEENIPWIMQTFFHGTLVC